MDLRYPVGKFSWKGSLSTEERERAIIEIAEAPARFREAVSDLKAEQLDTPYRDGGWTVRQVAHHVPDSHMNAYIRCKLALTEDRPTIKPYDEALWANLEDSKSVPIEVSLAILESVHSRWVGLLRSLRLEQFGRTFIHPEDKAEYSLDWLVGFYSWHGRHHTAHVSDLRKRMGWE